MLSEQQSCALAVSRADFLQQEEDEVSVRARFPAFSQLTRTLAPFGSSALEATRRHSSAAASGKVVALSSRLVSCRRFILKP